MKATRRHDKDSVFQALTDEIVAGELTPGTPLPERSLVERFGISRTPIRQVLWMLERDGLVDVLPNRGAFVKKLGAGEVIELFQLREALEPLAAMLAAAHRPGLEASALLRRMQEAEADNHRDTKELVALGAELHDALARWSGNRMLQRIYETLRMQTHLLRNLLHESEGSERSSLEEHIALVTAVEERDGDAAFMRMADHLRRARLAIIADLFSGGKAPFTPNAGFASPVPEALGGRPTGAAVESRAAEEPVGGPVPVVTRQ